MHNLGQPDRMFGWLGVWVRACLPNQLARKFEIPKKGGSVCIRNFSAENWDKVNIYVNRSCQVLCTKSNSSCYFKCFRSLGRQKKMLKSAAEIKHINM